MIDYLSSEGNRQYKDEFYQSRTRQLSLNDEVSLHAGVFCYYPYLDQEVVLPTHALAVQGKLSRSSDLKHGFRALVADVLPEYLKSHEAENEDFSRFNQRVYEGFIGEMDPGQLLLVDQGYVEPGIFKKYLRANKISIKTLARLYEHELFLRTF